MVRSVILLDGQPDALWRCYLRERVADAGGGDDAELVNLNVAAGRRHWLDVVGWRRWFKERCVERITCYQLTHKTMSVLGAAWLAGVDNTVVGTGRCEQRGRRRLRVVRPIVGRYCCWGKFVAAELREMGVAAGEIEVTMPTMSAAGRDDAAQGLRGRIAVTGPVLLALDGAGNPAALRGLIKVAGILKHMTTELKLVIAGPCSDRQRRHLLKRERNFDADEMLYVDRDRNDWRTLCAAADVVVAVQSGMVETLRLLQARQAGAAIVAVRGDSDELLGDYDRAYIADSAETRALAVAVVEALGSNRELRNS